jgi:methyl-accepting chemotaxis protein
VSAINEIGSIIEKIFTISAAISAGVIKQASATKDIAQTIQDVALGI